MKYLLIHFQSGIISILKFWKCGIIHKFISLQVKDPEKGDKYKKTWSKNDVITNQPGESIAVQNHMVI